MKNRFKDPVFRSKLQMMGEKVIISNRFGLITQKDELYRLYIENELGVIDRDILNLECCSFKLFDRFIIVNDIDWKTHMFIEGTTDDMLGASGSCVIWAGIDLDNIAENIATQVNYGHIQGVKDIIGVTNTGFNFLINYAGESMPLKNSLSQPDRIGYLRINYDKSTGLYTLYNIISNKNVKKLMVVTKDLEVVA